MAFQQLETLFSFQLNRYLFRAFENISFGREKLFCAFDRNVPKRKKVPFSRFKALFGKVRDAWKADNIYVKMVFFSPKNV